MSNNEPLQRRIVQEPKQYETISIGGDLSSKHPGYTSPLNEIQQKASKHSENHQHAELQKKANQFTQGKAIDTSQRDPIQRKNTSSSTHMPEEVQTKMESSFDTDFSSVNIHKNSSSATDVGALAYAQGNDVHFAPGQYNPNSQEGQELLGHELTHVVQQRQGRVQGTQNKGGENINKDESLEKEADAKGEKAAKGEKVAVTGTAIGVQLFDKDKKDNKEPTYREKVENSEAYKNFDPGFSPLGKWVEFHSQGESFYDEFSDKTLHQAKGKNNTYTSLAKKYQVSVEELKSYNQLLIAEHGDYIPPDSIIALYGPYITDEEPTADLNYSKTTIIEYIAHHLAYRTGKGQVSKQERKVLKQAGYAGDDLYYVDGEHGFNMVVIPSNTKGINPVIGLRGTAPNETASGMMTVYSDLDPKGVGYTQFAVNKEKIKKILNKLDGKIDVTGHSLGGAMAQRVAAAFAYKVGSLTTFQSPGVEQETVDEFLSNQNENEMEVTHHLVSGDLVDKGGQENIPGTFVYHDYGIKTPSTQEIEKNIIIRLTIISSYVERLKKDIREREEAGFWDKMSESSDVLADYALIGTALYELYQYATGIGTPMGEAHTKLILASKSQENSRDNLGLTDTLLTNSFKNENIEAQGLGLDEKTINQEQNVTKYSEYPFEEQRQTGDALRRKISNRIDSNFTEAEVKQLTKSIEEFSKKADPSYKEQAGFYLALWNTYGAKIENVINGILADYAPKK